MADGKTAQVPDADTTDIPAEVADLREEVTRLIADRDFALDQVGALTDRIAALETRPGGSGGANPAAVERELGKLRRPLTEVIQNYFRNTTIETAEPIVPPETANVGTVDSGSGSTVGATSEPTKP